MKPNTDIVKRVFLLFQLFALILVAIMIYIVQNRNASYEKALMSINDEDQKIIVVSDDNFRDVLSDINSEYSYYFLPGKYKLSFTIMIEKK